MSSSYKFILFFLFFCQFSFCQSFIPPHESAHEKNLLLIQNSSFFDSVPSFATKITPSKDNPMSSAFFTIGAISPSVNNRISSENISAFFAWGAKAPHFSKFLTDLGGCAPDEFFFTRQGEPSFFGTLQIQIGNYSDSIHLDAQTKNPIHINLSKVPPVFFIPKNPSHPPLLNLSFSGFAQSTYGVVHRYYRLVPAGKSFVCSQRTESYFSKYELPVNFSSSYIPESPEPLSIVLAPVDLEQTTVSTRFKFIVLSNLRAQNISFNSESHSSWAHFGAYDMHSDELGFLHVKKEEIIPNSSSSFVGSSSNNFPFANSSFHFISPKEFSPQNFSSQYYLHFNSDISLGFFGATLEFADDFNRVYKTKIIFQNRELSSVSLASKPILLIGKTGAQNYTVAFKEAVSADFSRRTYEHFAYFPKIENLAGILAIPALLILGIRLFTRL